VIAKLSTTFSPSLRGKVMKRFTRQKSSNPPTSPIEIDFGAAAAHAARVFSPEIYDVRIESAGVVWKNGNTSVVVDLVEIESGERVAIQPMWVDGPNANAGSLADEHRKIIATLLSLSGQPTAGNVQELIPKIAGLVFEARLVLETNGRTSRSFNAIAEIFTDGG
jgi:hypothetical protein